MSGGREKVQAARDVATWLDSIGEHHRANVIRSLCVSNAALVSTASILNKELRKLTGDASSS